jgi:uncharacterized membrane protein
MEQERFNIMDVLKAGWQKFLENPALLILTILFTAVFSMIPAAVQYLLNWLKSPYTNVLYWTIYVFINLISLVFSIGLMKIYLKLAYDETADFSDLVKHYRHFFRYLGAAILYGLIVLGGLILLIIPGIMWAIQFQFVYYFVVDKDMGPIEALKASSKLTRGSKWDIFGFDVMVILVSVLGLLCCCVGYLVAMPVCAVASAVVYRCLLETQNGVGIPPVLPVKPVSEPPATPENPQPPVE